MRLLNMTPHVIVLRSQEGDGKIEYREGGEIKAAAHPDARWSIYQRDVFREVATGKGHLLVRARAGAGKTSTLVEACKRLPSGTRAVACAFNKDIERELSSRIQGNPERGVSVEVMTLHAMGLRAVRKAWGRVVPDDKDTWTGAYLDALPREAPKGAIRKIAALAKGMLLERPAAIYRMASSRGLWPETYGQREDEQILRWIVGLLDNAVRRHQLIGFDDMVYIAARMGLVGDKYDVVFVDETQDMSPAQVKVARAHLAAGGRLVIIGDDRQAIYGFRGADSGGMDRMARELDAKVLPLSISYRCARSIAHLAATVVPDFAPAEGAAEGDIRYISLVSIGGEWREGDAVISRANAPLVLLCLQAIREGRRARINGREIGRTIAGLVRRSGATSVSDLLVYMDGWKEDALSKLPKAEDEDDADAVEEAAKEIFDMHETVLCLAEGQSSVQGILDRIESIFADKAGKDVLLFSSTHKAKGLEWDRVFILEWTYRKERGQEEENLWYVAVTRAKSTLFRVSESA